MNIKKIIKDYKSGKSLISIAKENHIGPIKVKIILKENKIKLRKHGETNRKFSFNERYFSQINTHEKAYWLGFIYADGNICKNRFTLTQKESDILYDFLKSIKCTKDIVYKYKRATKWVKNDTYICNRINFHSKKFCDDLNKHGIYPNKSHRNDGIPKMKESLKSSFIRGVFDGDGCISANTSNPKHKNNIEFSILSCSKRMILDIQKTLMKSCDLKKTKLKSRNSKLSTIQDYSVIYCGGKQCKRIFDFIYKSPYPRLERKYIKFINFFNKNVTKS